MIKELRERTGVGMGKCKEALEEAKGDMELAIANLRKAGMASAVKKEGRETKEGMIGTAETTKGIGVVEVNAETDFVVSNERFQQFVTDFAGSCQFISFGYRKLAEHTIEKDGHKQTVDQYRAGLVQTIGENIQIKRAKTFPKHSINRSVFTRILAEKL